MGLKPLVFDIEEQYKDFRKDFGEELELTPCYYCGIVADSTDHVIPRATIKTLQTLDDKSIKQLLQHPNRVTTVDACCECNSLLGASYQNTLAERKSELKKRLRRKYKKVLQTPDWTDEELSKLGYTLQTYITHCLYLKEILKKRLKW